MVSRLTAEKDIALGIRAFAQAAARLPGIRLRIVGSGPERPRLERMVRRLGMVPAVTFEPWQEDPTPLYAAADVFLSTSRYEGYGMALVEAVAAGVRAVATDVGVARELSDAGAPVSVVAAHDLTGCAEAIASAVRDADAPAPRFAFPPGVRVTAQGYLRALGATFALAYRPTLCYVLPEYNGRDATHLRHLHGLIEGVSGPFDLLLIIERGVLPPAALGFRAAWLIPAGIWRVPATFARVILARLGGCARFYVHYSFSAALAACVVRRIFGGTVWYWNCGEPWKYERSPWRRRLERFVYYAIDYLVTGTPSLAKAYAAHYAIAPEHVRVLANWIDVRAWQAEAARLRAEGVRERVRTALGLAPQAPLILFVHRLSRRKGAHLIADVVAQLANRKAALAVIGEGPLRLDLKRELESRSLSARVRFTGALPNDLLPRYYAAADVLLMPSSEEGFPHVLLEAMAAGLPFVATDVGGIRDIIPPPLASTLVPADNAAAAAAAVDRILAQSAAARARMAVSLARWVRRYDVSNAIKNFTALIHAR